MGIKEEINQRAFRTVHQQALINLLYSSNWLRDMYSFLKKEYGVTQQQYNVLRILKGKYPEVCSAKYVKSVMLDKSPDLTRLVDKLVDKGLVKREVCATNRRQIDLSITEHGMAKIQEMEESVRVGENTLAANLTEQEAAQLSSLLDKMRGQ